MKIISINPLSNILVYEEDNEVISMSNLPIYFVVMHENNRVEINANRIQFDLAHNNFDAIINKPGLIKVSDEKYVNLNFIKHIHLNTMQIELNNHSIVHFTSSYLPNIENYLNSISII